jgi:hypothetical protein
MTATWAMIAGLPSVKTVATGPDVYAAIWNPSTDTTFVVPTG